jgi:hypothetical protein
MATKNRCKEVVGFHLIFVLYLKIYAILEIYICFFLILYCSGHLH